MPGFLADADLTVNSIELRRQQSTDYIDSTSSNPTSNGLLFPADILADARPLLAFAPLSAQSPWVIDDPPSDCGSLCPTHTNVCYRSCTTYL
jgi:hypothetical protein